MAGTTGDGWPEPDHDRARHGSAYDRGVAHDDVQDGWPEDPAQYDADEQDPARRRPAPLAALSAMTPRLRVDLGSGGNAVLRFFSRALMALALLVLLITTPIVLLSAVWLTDALSEIAPRLDAPPQSASIVIQSADGQVIGYRGVYQGRRLEPDEIPEIVKEAVVAIEDRRFYEHAGIDLVGVSRAAWTNLRAGQILQGGSTITQQLAKLLFLSSERNLKRKIQESILALWLERHLSKDEILARYLNTAYFGAGAYGIDAAARRYFDKAVDEMSLSEAAMLAGLIRAPSLYNPFRNANLAHERTQLVLMAMAETGRVNRFSAIQAVNDPPRIIRRAAAAPISGYVTDFVTQRVHHRLNTLGGDFTVRTTIDPRLQAAAEKVVLDHLTGPGHDQKASQAALVAMAPDGAVLALVGGRDYEESQFNRATQARRQPGSLFKVFVYFTALSNGWHPDDFVIDQPIRVGAWRPRNYNDRYYGRMTLTNAFARSANSVAVRLQEQVGRDSVIEVAERLGLDSRLKAHPSLALGAFETTLLDITGSFASIAADRTGIQPYVIREMTNTQGLSFRHPDVIPGHALGPSRDYMMRLLRNTTRSGTGQVAGRNGEAYGKTGTTQDHRDAWFVGFTDDLVVGVWLGNDDNSPMDRVVGGGLPAEIWSAFMTEAQTIRQAPLQIAEAPVVPATPEPAADEPETQDPSAPPGETEEADPPADQEYWLTGPARVITTARLRIGGETVVLRGVIGEAGPHAARMQDYLDGKTVRCRVGVFQSASCTAGGTDVGVAAIFNGGAWAGPDATAKMHEAERRAREAGRGIWAAYGPDEAALRPTLTEDGPATL